MSYCQQCADAERALTAARERIARLEGALRELVASLGERQMDVPTPIMLRARAALSSMPKEPT